MSEHDPEATPEQQEQVRRLLAEARHTEPLPPEVAKRLEGVLAKLVAEGPASIDPPPQRAAAVVDLAARRRRRVTGLLVAAAAVVVVGIGVGQVIDTVGDGGNDDATSAGVSTSDQDRLEDAGGDSESSPLAPPGTPESADDPGPPPRIRAATFVDDVQRLRDVPGYDAPQAELVTADDVSDNPMFVCSPARWGPGRLLGVLYDGTPAVLAYRPSAGETVTVELLQCGSAQVLRSTVLPAE